MACYRPLKGWKSRILSDSGKRGITFRRSDAFVDLPLEVPCGQCIGCRIDRVRQWATRLVHESQFHAMKSFITLTYDDEHLPASESLVKRDLQLFMKRLRKAHGGKLRYFASGEYGGQFGRPHYHMILFGCDFSDRVKHSGRDGEDVLYVSAELNRLWGKGFCSIGSVTVDSCKYVASYVIEKITGKDADEYYRRVDPGTGEIVDLVPPFVVMSRRPGIGADWYDSFKSDLYPSDFAVVNGKQLGVPKFYDRLLEREDAQELKRLKLLRVRKGVARRADNTPERLRVREDVARARRRLATGV